MSNSLEPRIRVDQSHCNYQLSNHLIALGWTILFRDPGRATRGASGTQEQVLGIFERTGLPIPDIAAVRGTQLLLVEVDKSLKNNADCFVLYRQHSILILAEFVHWLMPAASVNALQLGFCKVGLERQAEKVLTAYCLDLVAHFDAHGPVLLWANIT